ncbi:MAG TPA: hypothetical protein VNO81_15160 [Candidatus Nitrosotenuis sp.]|jgi:phosphomannomutase|nr:hypothetical protein [Candidatus Nitrosotenuis sp.]
MAEAIFTRVSPQMTRAQMREYFLHQTRLSLEEWEQSHYPIQSNPPFRLEERGPLEFRFTPEVAERIGLRRQVEEFAREARVSTAGVRENQNVLCPWDFRYRFNEYIIALLAESLSRLVQELQPQRRAALPDIGPAEIRTRLGGVAAGVVEEVFQKPLAEVIPFVRDHPVRIVGGEVRANTPRYVALVSRIYAAHGLTVLLTENPENRDTSTIFMWSFLTYMLGLSGGDYFTSSHGAPQKQSDKILGPDGSQYLPPQYARIVEHMTEILETIEKDGYTVRLAPADDPRLVRRLTYPRMARLYADYLRKGPASPWALDTVRQAVDQGLRLKLDFFGGAGYRTLHPVFVDLGIEKVFEGGYIRTEEDPFFHDIGFRVARKKGSEDYEVVHDSVDASLPQVVATAGYDELLKDCPPGQAVFNVDPDSDRFVAGQVVAASEEAHLTRRGISFLPLGPDRLFALYSPNQFFLMLAENDRAVAVQEGFWEQYSNFDVHTYVSALSWDEWAAFHQIPVVRVPVGFKEIAAVERAVEEAMAARPGQPVSVRDEQGNEILIGPRPKVHHAGEESGGKICGPREPIYNVLGQHVIGMREKSSGEACISAVTLMARLYLEYRQSGDLSRMYLHNYLETIFAEHGIADPMEFRGDKVHYNEAIFDPEELARAKAAGVLERERYNSFFRLPAQMLKEGKLTLDQVRDLYSQALPGMAGDWQRLERIDVWSDGLQFWFAGGPVRTICLRPSGTDAKSKVYFNGTDKAYLERLFETHFRDFQPRFDARYRSLVPVPPELGD